MALPRAYWKGYLKHSLVTCAVSLYPASTQSEKTHFHQINRKTGNRLRQQMVDEDTGRVIEGDQKGRGYELSSGKYVEIEPGELEAVEIQSTHTIDIDKFVPDEEIDKRYYERPYYIVPEDENAAEAFAVIRDAMKDKGRVALARIVFANREHIVAIEPWGKGMLATTLRYDHEVRSEDDFFKSIPSPRIQKDMVELAGHILQRKSGHFDASKFKDEYELALRKLVKKKASGKVIERSEPEEKGSNVVNLMDALKEKPWQQGRAERQENKVQAPQISQFELAARRPESQLMVLRKPSPRFCITLATTTHNEDRDLQY
jgi:DNA end-binding protein Ku